MADRFKTSAPMISSETGGINYDGVSTDGTGAGNLTVSGLAALLGSVFQLGISASATNLGASNGATVPTATPVVRAFAGAGITGCILAPGTKNGQIVIVFNENFGSTTNTFAFHLTTATSNVLNDGTNAPVVKCGTAKVFVWVSALSAWMPIGPFAG